MEYSTYSDVLRLFHPSLSIDGRPDEEKILNPELGLAARMMSLCGNSIKEAGDPKRDFDFANSEVQTLEFERNTWDLVQQIYAYRKSVPPQVLSPSQLLSRNPYTPPDVLLQSILKTDTPSSSNTTTLSELHIVLQWLEKTTSIPPPVTTTTGYRRFSKTRVLHGKRTANWNAWEDMVQNLDPDSIYNSEDGLKKLASEDEGSQQALLRAAFLYIRAGQTDEIRELCRAAHEPWRGAVTRGRFVAGCSALDSDNTDDGSEVSCKWMGNKRRRLFKNICTRIALEPTSSPLNRLFHAALAPSQSTLHVLVGGIAEGYCRTWEDLLWARVNVLFEERWEAVLSKHERSGKRKRFVDVGMDDPDLDGPAWENDVRNVLESMESVQVEEGPDAKDPFHVAQLYIVLNCVDLLCRRMADIFETVSLDLSLDENSPDYQSYCRYLRFYSHLILYLRYLDVPIPAEEADKIILLYINLLEKTEGSGLLAQYCAELSNGSNNRYADYLLHLPLSVKALQRLEALNVAGKSGLDVFEIAIRTAEGTARVALETLPRARDLVDTRAIVHEEHDEREEYLIRSLEWVVNYRETYECASRLASLCIKYFLSIGKPGAAIDIHAYLPIDLFSDGTVTDEKFKEEYLGWTTFIQTWKSFEKVEEVAKSGVEIDTTGDNRRTRWIRKYSESLEECWEKTLEVLTSDWPLEFDDDDPNAFDYRRIRRIYIPQLTRRLHKALVASRRHLPKSHKRIFELVNIVADDRYGVVSELQERSSPGEKTQLEMYLEDVKDAVISGLDKGGSDPFYGIAKEDSR